VDERPRHRSDRRRVVVTGLGALTGVGRDAEQTWQNLLAGRSGVGPMTLCDPSQFPCRIASEVKGFKVPDVVDAKDARRMSRFEHFAVAAAAEAIAGARLDLEEIDRDQVGVILGNGGCSLPQIQQEVKVMFERGGMRINPFFLPMILGNMTTAQVSRVFGLTGYSTAIGTACAAASQAIGEAAEVIRRGAAEIMIAGGSEAGISEIGIASFSVLRALSQRNDEPERASRPFEADRDGLVPAEGAGVVVLESLEAARRRRAPIIAEIIGYGVSSDAYHVVQPQPEGVQVAKALRRALDDAGIGPEDVDYINAHATSTVLGDAAETRAIKQVFGERAYRIPISATKSMIGHSFGAAGGIGAVITLLTIRDRRIHPTINYERPDPDNDLDYVPNEAREAPVDVALANAFAFGGHNSVLVFSRYCDE
jgi:3-oxoacyl-[acyl-carrier-protein] synthase II